MDDVTALRALLNDTDPRAGETVGHADRQRARTKAITLMNDTPARRPLWLRPPALAGAAALTAAATAAVLVLGTGSGDPVGVPAAYAAPPTPLEVVGSAPEPGEQRLLALAETARNGGDAPGEGDVAYVSSSGVELLTVTSYAGEEPSDEDLHSAGFIPYEWQRWQGPEGDTREITVPGGAEDTTGDAEEHREFLDRQAEDVEERLEPELLFPGELPTEPGAMTDVLADWSGEETPDDAALVNALNHLYESRPLDGAEEAALLGVLAGLPGVEYAGSTHDPLAREGELFQVRVEEAGQVTRHRYLFASDTADLLYRDTTVLEEEGGEGSLARHGLELPVTTAYRSFVWSGWVEEVGARPGS
ncbi:CU044_5270 family protein [Nocardiopsis dassonvillei]|uniref:CU044_5270 family protein n=1 Tax=Nocardiopsis dassonvillei TaxID=2014 RepID=UPI0033FBF829